MTIKTLTHTLRKELAAAPSSINDLVTKVRRELGDWSVKSTQQGFDKDNSYHALYEGNALSFKLTVEPRGDKVYVQMDFDLDQTKKGLDLFKTLASELRTSFDSVYKATLVEAKSSAGDIGKAMTKSGTSLKKLLADFQSQASGVKQHIVSEVDWLSEVQEELQEALGVFNKL